MHAFSQLPEENRFAITLWGLLDLDSWLIDFWGNPEWPSFSTRSYVPSRRLTVFWKRLKRISERHARRCREPRPTHRSVAGTCRDGARPHARSGWHVTRLRACQVRQSMLAPASCAVGARLSAAPAAWHPTTQGDDTERYSPTCGSSACGSPLISARQVPTFHAGARIAFSPPVCRMPLGQ